MERKLATIVTIKDLQPIPGADQIEVATVRGWKVVVKKGEFFKDTKAVYFEIDSFLPIREEFEFLRRSCYRKYQDSSREGFRLRTIKLRGQVSQGLLLPVHTFFNDPNWTVDKYEDQDVTEMLNIVKYDPPIPVQMRGQVKDNFPSFLKKTDEERVQNIDPADIAGKFCYVTEKLDGTSFTCYYNDGVFGVCSRNLDLKETEGNLYWDIAKQYDLREKLEKLNINIAIQGEIIGPGIQNNTYNLPTRELRVFTVFDIDSQSRILPYWEVCEDLELKKVPIVCNNMEIPTENTIKSLVEMADGKSVINPNSRREGLVFRGQLGEFSFKAISNQWLLKSESIE